MKNKYRAALDGLQLNEAEKARLAAEVAHGLAQKRARKKRLYHILLPALSAAALCVIALPLVIAWQPAGEEAPNDSQPPASGDELPEDSDGDPGEDLEAFSCIYEGGGVRLCLNFDLNKIR